MIKIIFTLICTNCGDEIEKAYSVESGEFIIDLDCPGNMLTFKCEECNHEIVVDAISTDNSDEDEL